MLSASSAGPYMPDMPMQPRASGKTSGPLRPRRRVSAPVWVVMKPTVESAAAKGNPARRCVNTSATMNDSEQIDGGQTALWNGGAGQGWVAMQDLIDRLYRPFEDLLVDAVASGLERRRARRRLRYGRDDGRRRAPARPRQPLHRHRHLRADDRRRPRPRRTARARRRGSSAPTRRPTRSSRRASTRSCRASASCSSTIRCAPSPTCGGPRPTAPRCGASPGAAPRRTRS